MGVKQRLRVRAGRFWHEYTRMRTAIYFLAAICVIVLIGSFVPQQDTSATTKVQDFLTNHANLNALGSSLGLPLTQVFVSPVFYVLLGSLYIALGACVLRRGRALVMRTIRRQRRTPQYWGEWGSWLFHTSFFLLLIAVVWGKATGFQGEMAITTGTTFVDTPSQYDQLKEGLLSNGQHAGFAVKLNSFSASYDPNSGEPADFVSNVTVTDHGQNVKTQDIRVNQFLNYDDVDFYQLDYGWAPHIVVTNPSGKVVFNEYVQMFSGNDGSKARQSGVVKVPDFNYVIPGSGGVSTQFGANVAIIPDAKETAQVNSDGTIDPTKVSYSSGGQEARNPVLQLQPYIGDLGLNQGQTQSVTSLNTSGMSELTPGQFPPVTLGSSTELFLPGANNQLVPFTVSFPDLKQYSAFLVKKDNGVGLVYASFFLIMAGLITKLYVKPLSEARLKRRRDKQTALSGAAPLKVRLPAPAAADYATDSREETDAATLVAAAIDSGE
jgi:cytochrome c biogenesis protein ResB